MAILSRRSFSRLIASALAAPAVFRLDHALAFDASVNYVRNGDFAQWSPGPWNTENTKAYSAIHGREVETSHYPELNPYVDPVIPYWTYSPPERPRMGMMTGSGGLPAQNMCTLPGTVFVPAGESGFRIPGCLWRHSTTVKAPRIDPNYWFDHYFNFVRAIPGEGLYLRSLPPVFSDGLGPTRAMQVVEGLIPTASYRLSFTARHLSVCPGPLEAGVDAVKLIEGPSMGDSTVAYAANFQAMATSHILYIQMNLPSASAKTSKVIRNVAIRQVGPPTDPLVATLEPPVVVDPTTDQPTTGGGSLNLVGSNGSGGAAGRFSNSARSGEVLRYSGPGLRGQVSGATADATNIASMLD